MIRRSQGTAFDGDRPTCLLSELSAGPTRESAYLRLVGRRLPACSMQLAVLSVLGQRRLHLILRKV